MLVGHPSGNRPKTHALLALMLLSGARLPARADAGGNILLLAEQDRALWDKAMIQRGLWHLNQSAAGEEISEFHLQAGIAGCHCTASTYEATNWPHILSLYGSAISNVHGARAALGVVGAIPARNVLETYYLFHAVLGHLYYALGDFDEAARGFRRASELTGTTSEQAFLARRLAECAQLNHAVAPYACDPDISFVKGQAPKGRSHGEALQ